MAYKPRTYYETIAIGDWRTKRELDRMKTKRTGNIIPKTKIKSMVRRKFGVPASAILSVEGPISGSVVDYVVWVNVE